MRPDASVIDMPLRYYRAAPSKSKTLRVERNGGRYGAGLIRGASLITQGEALGHDQWIDSVFTQSVADAVNGHPKGAKARFTHPSLSGDGLGRFMGRASDAYVENGQAFADFHFAKAAHETPDGNLAEYVMGLAEEDPEAFAISIAFQQDRDASRAFASEHTTDGEFRSPDTANQANLPHVRLSELVAADFVDTPAANPGGLFHRGHEVAEQADKLFAFALGLSDEKPNESFFSADADRVAAFAQRFLSSRGLTLMSEKQDPPADEPQGVTVEQYNAVVEKLSAVEAKLAEFNQPEPVDESADQLKAERERCRELYALASRTGLEDAEKVADEWIEKGFSAVEAKASIADRLIDSNRFTRDSGQPEDDPHAKYRKEFRDGREEFARFGIVDEDAYIRSRCRDDGLPVPPVKKAG